MPTWVLIVVAVCIFDVFVVTLIARKAIGGSLGAIAERYPALEPQADAVRRGHQQFRMGLANLGFMTVAVDDDHLHLTPPGFLRWFGGHPSSVPWSAMSVRRVTRNGKRVVVSIDGVGGELQGPEWCLGLVDADAAAP